MPWSHYPNKSVFSDRQNRLYGKLAYLRCGSKLFHSPDRQLQKLCRQRCCGYMVVQRLTGAVVCLHAARVNVDNGWPNTSLRFTHKLVHADQPPIPRCNALPVASRHDLCKQHQVWHVLGAGPLSRDGHPGHKPTEQKPPAQTPLSVKKRRLNSGGGKGGGEGGHAPRAALCRGRHLEGNSEIRPLFWRIAGWKTARNVVS